ncbi:MAG: radical SAM protein [bacterium]|nr:radical SAM protein [bacterium]
MGEVVEVLIANTWSCNLRCKYCFVKTNRVEKIEADMTVETATRAIDALDEGLGDFAERICMHLYGGEPFINLDAIEAMIERASQKKTGRFSFAVTTNGTLLSDRLINILEAGKFNIILSIDGPPEIHDECRITAKGAPCHSDVLEFLENVKKRTSCHVTGSSVIRSGSRMIKVQEYLRSLPIDAIKAQAVRAPMGSPYVLTPEERIVYMQDLEAVGKLVIKDLEANRYPMDGRFSSRVLGFLTNYKREHFCNAGHKTYGISPSGNVYPCILVTEVEASLGHINDDPQIWIENGRKWRQKLKRKECSSCSILDYCGGGCPAIIPVCGDDECELINKNHEISKMIFDHFKDNQEALLTLAGIL